MSCSTIKKNALWILWGVNLVFSVVYVGLSSSTFYFVKRVRIDYDHSVKAETRKAYKDSMLTACMLGILIVIFWMIFSLFVMIGKIFKDLTLSHGALLGTCSHTGFFMLLAALVLNGQDFLLKQAKNQGGTTEYQTYVATYVFSYILCSTFLLMFIYLAYSSRSTSKQKNQRSASYMTSSSSTVAA